MVNPRKYEENDEWKTTSISDVTVHINTAGGVDTATDRYLNMGTGSAGMATSLILRTDNVITIEEINERSLKVAMSIPANGSWTQSRRSRLKIKSFKINVLTADTNLKLYVNTTGNRGT